jgi:hypothetical protein
MNEANRQGIIEPKTGEPWVKLHNGHELARWSRDDEIAYNQVNWQTQKFMFYVQAFDFMAANRIAGDYYEFGCHRGRTFRMALTEARRHNLKDMRFFAFDSFQGLPEVKSATNVPFWQKGALATSEADFWNMIRDHGIYIDSCRTIPGYYEETLTETLQASFLNGGSRIAMACIDCDLYESAVPVFRFIDPLLQEGSVVYLDDYFSGNGGSPARGVARAFREYQQQSRFQFVEHMQVGWWGRSYIAYREC